MRRSINDCSRIRKRLFLLSAALLVFLFPVTAIGAAILYVRIPKEYRGPFPDADPLAVGLLAGVANILLARYLLTKVRWAQSDIPMPQNEDHHARIDVCISRPDGSGRKKEVFSSANELLQTLNEWKALYVSDIMLPDHSWWIAHAPQMCGRRRVDLRVDPPPDLAVEVDVTHRSLDRMSIYARLKVPEVWRLDAHSLTFQVLQPDSRYAGQTHSLSFPQFTPADLTAHLALRAHHDENEVVRQFRNFVRQRLSTGTNPASTAAP
jgi:Uma2 family endonuclease